ncbi:hypothetical protein Esti_000452 [Eimeria stiedai]|uniref:Dense-granule antigen DG32 n=1 Tax=Eimeria stiedai TaxID=471275 RepID=A0A9E9FYI3_9EIME|nr:dense-granule antigen DG32 [Eimeria stiedai]
MRFAAVAVALVATLQCLCVVEGGDSPSLSEVAAKKLVEESVGAPVSEFWKDVYETLVRKHGSSALRALKFKMASVLGNDRALELTKLLMDKLKKDVFDGDVNKTTWDRLTMELYFILKDWFSTTPENPKDAAEVGAWQALLKLYKDILGPALRGSPRVSAMNSLLLDPELATLRSWVQGFGKGGSRSGRSKSSRKEKKE